jgi:DNA polymerase-3 subunit gamma/tau
LSILDQLIAGSGEQGVTYNRAVALLGVTDVALIDEMVDALSAGDGAAAFAAIERVADAGHDPRRFASDLLERLRDLIVLQRVGQAVESGIIDAPADQLERMAGQAARIGPATLSRLADIVHNGLTEMRGATAPRLLLELITARMLLPGVDDSTSGLLHRLERMERRLGAADPAVVAELTGAERAPRVEAPVRAVDQGRPVERATPAPAPSRAGTPAPAAAPPSTRSAPPARQPQTSTVDQPPAAASGSARPPAPVGAVDAATVRREWDEILKLVNRGGGRVVAAMLRDCAVRDVLGDELVLLTRHSAHVNKIQDQAGLLTSALYEMLGGTWRIRVEVGGDERARQESRPAPPPPAGPGRTSAAPSNGGDDAWPEITRPGGAASASPAQAPARPATQVAAPARPAKAAPARAVVSPTRPSPARGGRGRDDDAPLPDEPPFDPEYDGFDPGDEPLDDSTPGARVSSEEQALRAVTEQFPAVERIGDTGPRS